MTDGNHDRPSPGGRWRHRGRGLVGVDTAAARAQAYIYGNIVVLATLALIGPDEVSEVEGLLLLIGTVVSTFLAHALAESYGRRIRSGLRPTAASIVETLRDSLPVLTAGAVPTVLLLAGLTGVLNETVVFTLAVLSVTIRFLLLGFTIGHLRGTQSSWRTIGTGVVLAVLGVAAAAFKLVISH